MGYPIETYKRAKQMLEKQRIRNEQDLEQRRKILFARSPKAERIEQNIARTSIMAARAVLNGRNLKTELEALKEKNQACQQELESIIASLGFPSDYLDMRYQCNDCQDTGYIDGKMCHCLKRMMRDLEYERLNKTSLLKLSDFDTFSLDYYSKVLKEGQSISDYERMAKVLAYCKKYANEFSEHSASLLMHGEPGLGKTHLSLAVAKSAIDKGYGVIYVSAPTVLEQIADEHFGSDGNVHRTERSVTECDLLVLDDLGTEVQTPFYKAAIYNIINKRLITSQPTIISTNYEPEEFSDIYDTRIASRLMTLNRIGFVGTDVRLKKMIAQHPVSD